ncbi:hypothetical protein FHETE_755 [Fusarium heterosporum]|uniref:Uncharacterized protein n=1 Tax=Fusarium heterosporum TaxID=42747 RepID=A0A8H5U1T6_FUSHE|nr:hypothetical protein FHETE_755 [Fusarium heterosporum]
MSNLRFSPKGWTPRGVEALASLDNLYLERVYDSPDHKWHFWIYLSSQTNPLNDPWSADPWDKAFLELLQHRDKHEPQRRWNFSYLTCPGSFLCGSWQVSGPALMHFTNEPLVNDQRMDWSSPPVYDPVTVRLFELPLREPMIYGVFPSHLEQMKFITASNSTVWTSKKPFTRGDQFARQAVNEHKRLQEVYPWTYGMLVRGEEKWARFWALENTRLVNGPYEYARRVGEFCSIRWERLSLNLNGKRILLQNISEPFSML